MVGNRRFAVVERGIASGSDEINEVFAAGVGIIIDFKSGVGISALSVLGKLVLVKVRAVGVAGVGWSVALWAAIAEGRVYAFVEEFRGCASCPALAFKVFHEAVQSVRTRCAVSRDPRQLVSVCFPQPRRISSCGRIFYPRKL